MVEIKSNKYFLCLILLFLLSLCDCYAQVTVGTIKQISVGVNNTIPAGASGTPVVASNGQFLIFSSGASNLVDSDKNNAKDIFITQLTNGVTSRVSVNSLGAEGNFDSINSAAFVF